jgi:hypothetical protein
MGASDQDRPVNLMALVQAQRTHLNSRREMSERLRAISQRANES